MYETEIVSCRVLNISPTITALLRKVHCNAIFKCARRDSPSRALKMPHRGIFAPRDAMRGARAVRIPLFYCHIKSVQNKKSSTPQGTALGATRRIRTSGLPGRSRTLYPAELRSLMYEKRRYSVFQSCKVVNFQ